MSYYIQCDCGKKLTKKPMKTLRCPRCSSVYKKPKKFILAVYICLLVFFMLAFALIPDKMGILASAGSGIGAYIMFLWIVDTLNFDLLDAVILVAGFLIFKPVWLLLKIAIFSVIDGFIGMVKILKILNPLFIIAKVRAAATAIALKAQAVASWLVGARLRFALVWTQLYNLATKRLTMSVLIQRAAMIAHAIASKAAAAAMAILRGASIAAAAGFRIMKLALITTGIGAIVVGLATAAVWLYENWDRVKAFFQNFWQKIKPEWENFKSWLDSWIEAFSSAFDETVAWWKDLFADFFGWIGEKIDWVLSSVKSVGEFFGFGDSSAPVMAPAYANADRNFTPAPNRPMGEALSTLSSSRAAGNTNVVFNGDFKIDTHGQSIDTEAFRRQISKDVQEAIRRNERNAKNTDVRG